jgi:hypothetical protein
MNVTPEQPAGHADILWPRITGESGSGSFIEDHLGSLVDGTAAGPGRFRVDVVYLDRAASELG